MTDICVKQDLKHGMGKSDTVAVRQIAQRFGMESGLQATVNGIQIKTFCICNCYSCRPMLSCFQHWYFTHLYFRLWLVLELFQQRVFHKSDTFGQKDKPHCVIWYKTDVVSNRLKDISTFNKGLLGYSFIWCFYNIIQINCRNAIACVSKQTTMLDYHRLTRQKPVSFCRILWRAKCNFKSCHSTWCSCLGFISHATGFYDLLIVVYMVMIQNGYFYHEMSHATLNFCHLILAVTWRCRVTSRGFSCFLFGWSKLWIICHGLITHVGRSIKIIL